MFLTALSFVLSAAVTGPTSSDEILAHADCVVCYEADVLVSSAEMGFDQHLPFRGVGTAIGERFVVVPRDAFAVDAAAMFGFPGEDEAGDFGMPAVEITLEDLAVWVGDQRRAARRLHEDPELGVVVLEVEVAEGESLRCPFVAEAAGTTQNAPPSPALGTSLLQLSRAGERFGRVPLLRRVDVVGRSLRPRPGLLLEADATAAAPVFDSEGRFLGVVVPGPADSQNSGMASGRSEEPRPLISTEDLLTLREKALANREL